MGQHVIVPNPDGPDFEFEGEQLIDHASGELGLVQIYRTQGGSYVVRQHRGNLPYKHGVNRADVLDDLDAVAEWLGNSPGAKQIMEELGRPYRRYVR